MTKTSFSAALTVTLLALAGLCLVSAANPASARVLFRAKADGDAAQVQWVDFNIVGFVSVIRTKFANGGTTRDRETFLQYFVMDSTTSVVLESGHGIIPNTGFAGDGTSHLRLDIDTTLIPGFTITAGSGGVISVDWTRMIGGVGSSRTAGSTEVVFLGPGITTTTSGISRISLASVVGVVAGHVIGGNTFPLIASNNNVTITMERGP